MKRIFKLLNPRRIAWLFVFLIIQAATLLLIPTIAADIVDYGVALGDIDYIIRNGGLMVVVALIGFIASILNVYFSATESQAVGSILREQLFDKIMYFSNEEIDQLLDEEKRESDEATREQIYKDAQEILIDEAPAIFIRYPENLNAYQSDINGLTIDNNNLLDLRNVTRE